MLYSIIKQLQETSSTNDKLAIMEQHKDNMLLKEYMRLVSCPSVNFYITAKTFPTMPMPMAHQVSFDMKDLEHAERTFAKRMLTGDAAKLGIRHWLADQATEQDQELCRMLLLKDIRAKVGVTLVNKVWDKLCVDVSYQRCSLPDEKNLKAFSKGETFIVQTKSDGQFAALVLDADVQLYTRNGSTYPQWMAEYIAEGLNDTNAVYEGELLCYRNGQMLSRKEGNGILNSILQGGELPEGVDVLYTVWNRLQLNEWKEGKTDTKYSICFDNALFKLTKCKPKHMQMIDSCYVHSLDSAYEFNKEQLAKGLEGSIIKTLTHKWKNGTSKECLKLKVEAEIDLIWTGSVEGKGKAAGMLGAMCLQSSCGRVKVDCGTGYTDAQRKQLWQERDSLHGSVVTVKANDLVTKEGSDTLSLFLPVFIELREKKGADSLERIEQIFNAAKYIA
jgi:DNA ligase-1